MLSRSVVLPRELWIAVPIGYIAAGTLNAVPIGYIAAGTLLLPPRSAILPRELNAVPIGYSAAGILSNAFQATWRQAPLSLVAPIRPAESKDLLEGRTTRGAQRVCTRATRHTT